MDAYLDFLLCVFMTLLVLLALGFTIYLAWNTFIEPILDRIKEQKDDYWEKQYREERDEYDTFLKMIKIDRFTARRIIPGTVETLTSGDGCKEFESHALIKFKVDLSDYYKM